MGIKEVLKIFCDNYGWGIGNYGDCCAEYGFGYGLGYYGRGYGYGWGYIDDSGESAENLYINGMEVIEK